MSYKPTHAKRSALVKAAARGGVIAGAAAIAAASAGALAPGVANAATTSASYTQNGSYQFASDTYDYNGTTGDYIVNDSPESHSDSGQSLGSDGVDLSIEPSTSGYSDSGIIVPLGTLSSLFNSAGAYVGPKIAGSSNLGANFYFGTNGSTTSSGTLNGSDVLTGADGDSYASVGVSGTTADFSTFAGYSGTGTLFTDLSGSVSMPAVAADYKTEDGYEGVKTDDPEVWAWIGISGNAAETGHVTSVNGADLVNSPTYTATGGTNGKIENADSGKYLNVSSNTYAQGDGLIQWDATGASHETFQYVTVKNSSGAVVGGYLQAEDLATGKWYYVTAGGRRWRGHPEGTRRPALSGAGVQRPRPGGTPVVFPLPAQLSHVPRRLGCHSSHRETREPHVHCTSTEAGQHRRAGRAVAGPAP
jgi:hypothetical protein